MKRVLFLGLLPIVAFFGVIQLAGCGSKSHDNQEVLLPHRQMGEPKELSGKEAQALMNAEGKSARSGSLLVLESFVRQDTAPLIILNFWKKDCKDCLDLQMYLQNIQLSVQEDRMKIYAVNLDAPADSNQVNLALRKAGITSNVFQLTDPKQLAQSKLTPGWSDTLPAVSLLGGEFPGAFYQQNFSENELWALLQPFLL